MNGQNYSILTYKGKGFKMIKDLLKIDNTNRLVLDVSSSMIKSLKYDENKRQLEVLFNKGSIYTYTRVPVRVVSSLVKCAINGQSIGKFFHKHIKKYDAVKMN